MIKRRCHDRIRRLIRHFPAVALLGPRQVGKTTLALDIAESLPSIYLDLEFKIHNGQFAIYEL